MIVDDQAPKPSSPPPPYTDIAEPSQRLPQPELADSPSGPSHSPFSPPSPSQVPLLSSQAIYGPTPIVQQTTLLPYYDPQSPYSIAAARKRALQRFLGAVLWAVGILVFVGLVFGGGEMQRRSGRP